jgi:hypothetical protein
MTALVFNGQAFKLAAKKVGIQARIMAQERVACGTQARMK